MGILDWVVYTAVSPDFGSDSLGAGVTRIMLLAVGLIWLFVLSMIIVRREEGALRWTTIKRRLHELGMTFLPLQIVLSEGKAAEGEEQL